MIEPGDRKDGPDLILEADSFVEFEDRNILDTIDKSQLPPKRYPKIVAPDDEPTDEPDPE
jgi:hypothetical protein